MPRHPDFEKIYQNFKANPDYSQDPEDPKYFEKMYYAWLNKNKLDDTKPFPKDFKEAKILNIDETELAQMEKAVETARGLLQAIERRLEIWVYGKPEPETPAAPLEIKEAFNWLPPLKYHPELSTLSLIYGVAIVEGETVNKTRVSGEELIRGARTLINKPLTIDHYDAETGFNLPYFYEEKYPGISNPYPVGVILDAEEEAGQVEWLGVSLNEAFFKLVQEGKVKGSSVWMKPRKTTVVNGHMPEGIIFEDLTICLEQLPASKGTWVKPVPQEMFQTSIHECFRKMKMSQVLEKKESEKMSVEEKEKETEKDAVPNLEKLGYLAGKVDVLETKLTSLETELISLKEGFSTFKATAEKTVEEIKASLAVKPLKETVPTGRGLVSVSELEETEQMEADSWREGRKRELGIKELSEQERKAIREFGKKQLS